MPQEIIALSGKANMGKTQTIILTYELILQELGIKVDTYEKLGHTDFRAIVLISNKRIGFISQGYMRCLVEKHLAKLQQCSVIVCATRTRGQTVKAVTKYKPSDEVHWLKKLGCESSNQAKSNETMALKIIKLVKSAVSDITS